MSQFTEWSKNLLIDLDVTQEKITEKPAIEIDPMIDFDAQLKSIVNFAFKQKTNFGNSVVDTNEITNFSKIHRDLIKKSVTKKINAYDTSKKNTNDKYKTYSQSMQSEVAAVDANENLDTHLDTLLCKKLDLCVSEKIVSPAALKKISEQEVVQQQRASEYLKKTQQLRALISTHDASKIANNPEYVSFEASCADNEIGDSEDITFCITDKAAIATPYFN